MNDLTCKRCDHSWRKRSDNDPKRCPNCGTAYWDREVVRRNVSDKIKEYWNKKKEGK